MSALIYTDGACGKNRVGGWSWILVHDDRFITGSLGRAIDTTNQRMELFAAINALVWFSKGVDDPLDVSVFRQNYHQIIKTSWMVD